MNKQRLLDAVGEVYEALLEHIPSDQAVEITSVHLEAGLYPSITFTWQQPDDPGGEAQVKVISFHREPNY